MGVISNTTPFESWKPTFTFATWLLTLAQKSAKHISFPVVIVYDKSIIRWWASWVQIIDMTSWHHYRFKLILCLCIASNRLFLFGRNVLIIWFGKINVAWEEKKCDPNQYWRRYLVRNDVFDFCFTRMSLDFIFCFMCIGVCCIWITKVHIG